MVLNDKEVDDTIDHDVQIKGLFNPDATMTIILENKNDHINI